MIGQCGNLFVWQYIGALIRSSQHPRINRMLETFFFLKIRKQRDFFPFLMKSINYYSYFCLFIILRRVYRFCLIQRKCVAVSEETFLFLFP
jgi:hypothetical protein